MRPQGDNGAMDSGGCCCARPRVQQQARPEKRSYPRGLWRGVFRHAPFFVALKVAPAYVTVSEDVVFSECSDFCFCFGTHASSHLAHLVIAALFRASRGIWHAAA